MIDKIRDTIGDTIDDIGQWLKDETPTSIRERWLQPRQEPAARPVNEVPDRTVAPSIIEQEATDSAFEMEAPEEDLFTQEEDTRLDSEILAEKIRSEAEALEVVKRFDEGALVTKQDAGQARSSHLQDLMKFENAQNKGLVKTATGSKWMPIKSGEGRGPDKSMSEYEIGHGIKIPESWMSDNKRDWPMVRGVKVNIKEGLTKDQEESLVRDLLEKSYTQAEKVIPGWKDISENEKTFWGDFIYNGGKGVLDKNPKAKAALAKGNTTEAMIRSLDFIGSAGKPARGLLKRRISMYNKAASEINGAPIIEEYTFGPEIKVKFAHGFMDDKVSNKFLSNVDADNQLFFKSWSGKADGEPASYTMDDDLMFHEDIPVEPEGPGFIVRALNKLNSFAGKINSLEGNMKDEIKEIVKDSEAWFEENDPDKKADRLHEEILAEYESWSQEEREEYGVGGDYIQRARERYAASKQVAIDRTEKQVAEFEKSRKSVEEEFYLGAKAMSEAERKRAGISKAWLEKAEKKYEG